jgi:pyruvate kinase
MKRTKIVATIGPASEDKKMLVQMVKAGLDAARLNFSHGVHENHLRLINLIRSVSAELGTTVTILQDLQGPRIRIGEMNESGWEVKHGDELVLVYSTKKFNSPKKNEMPIIPIHYPLDKDLKKGEKILIEDGLIQLQVKKIVAGKIICETLVGGVIKTHKGMNFPESHLHGAALTKKDLSDLAFGIKNGVDFVAMSFVKDQYDIINLREHIFNLEKKFGRIKSGQKNPATKIIAKIERTEAVHNFDKILKAVDGIMVARGDLGIELPFEKVPLIQKEIIWKCNYAGKPVIVATQMLDSMIRNPLPTRAEVSDVANAILDGADAVMLSGESASGKYPLLAVSAMRRIAKEVEPAQFRMQQELESHLKNIKTIPDFVAFNAQDVAERMEAKTIICLTENGDMARLINRYKSRVPLAVFTPSETICRQLNLSWGVSTYRIPFSHSEADIIKNALTILKQKKRLKKGDKVAIAAGQIFSYFKKNNFLELEKV